MVKALERETGSPGVDYSVPSLERAMAMIELLTQHPEGLGLVAIARELGVPKNSVFRIGQALVAMGYLHRDSEGKRYTVSRKLLILGLRTVHEVNIVERSHELLRDFRDEVGESVALGALLLSQGQGVILASLEGLHNYGYFLRVGFQYELHCSGPGKAQLAFLPEKQYSRIIEKMSFEKLTPNTITSADKLSKELEEVRRKGYAFDHEEYVAGARCVSAPVFDPYGYPVAAIWVASFVERLPKKRYAEVGECVKHYAELISKSLAEPA